MRNSVFVLVFLAIIAFGFSSCEDTIETCYDCTSTTRAIAPGIAPIVSGSNYTFCGTKSEKEELEQPVTVTTKVNGITATATTITHCR